MEDKTDSELQSMPRGTNNISLNMHQSSKDLFGDSFLLSNTSSLYEPSELGSMSSMDESATDYIANDFHDFALDQLRDKYKKEFKAAIKDSYKYMMNDDIVESCKFTEGELSAFDSDDMIQEGHALSYNEFVKQYQDFIDWLKAIREQLCQSNPLCLSEKYLNQAHLEELLQRLTRRTQFDEYANQLIQRCPSLKDDIISRRNHVNEMWNNLEGVVSCNDSGNSLNILRDVEMDLSNFESWLSLMSKNLKELQHQVSNSDTSKEKLLEVIKIQHKEVQPKSKFINSMLQMCDNLSSWKPLLEERIAAAKNKARSLQHKWESLFIQILEWQLRIEEDYVTHTWNHDVSNRSNSQEEEIENDSEDLFMVNSNILPSIDEDIEVSGHLDHKTTPNHSKYKDNKVSDLSKEKRFTNYDFGYSSEGQYSHNGLKCKALLELKKHSCSCNVGSDFSDSSGIGVSVTTGSCIGKSKSFSNEITAARVNGESSDIRTMTEAGSSSLPGTEDEFSYDEMPFHSPVHRGLTRSLDLLSCPLESDVCFDLSDSAFSDGELLPNCRNYKYSPGVMQKHRPNKDKSLHKYRSSDYFVKSSAKLIKTPKKRKFGNPLTCNSSDDIEPVYKDNLQISKIRKMQIHGNFMENLERRGQWNQKFQSDKMIAQQRGDDQLVPGLDIITGDMNSLQSEIEVSGDEFGSNLDFCLEDKFGSKWHSTPKASRKMCNSNTTFESDSDVEDFRIMMEDSLKAFTFTKNSVAQTVRSSRRMLDSIEFLEPLATCQTSIKCLKDLEEAFRSTKGKSFGALDVLQMQSLMRDWTNLESQILHHLDSGRQIILSEVDLLQNQMSVCENAINSVDQSKLDFNSEVLMSIIHCYKSEKEKLLEIRNNFEELKKSVAPLSNKKSLLKLFCYGDISIKLEYFGVLCHSLVVKVGTLLSSYLEVFDSSLKFCKLSQDMGELMKQFEKYLDMSPECVSILTSEKKNVWLEMTMKLNEMECILDNVESTNPVHHWLQKKLETITIAFKNLEIKKESVIENLLLKEKQKEVESKHGNSSRPYGIMKGILQIGLPISAALLFGWMYSRSSDICDEGFHDWGLVLFPNLQHVRGRPPI